MRKSYFRLINILALSLILVLSIANPVLADAGEASREVKDVDGYKVKLTFVEGDVQLGHNKLNIEIKDTQGQVVGDATVTVIAELYRETSENSAKDMDKHSSAKTSAQKGTSIEAPIRTVKAAMKAVQKIGEYEGEVELEETGHWMIKVVFLIQSQEKVAEFVADVHGAPNGWVILSSFLGINVGIISVAAITRRKSANTPALEETR